MLKEPEQVKRARRQQQDTRECNQAEKHRWAFAKQGVGFLGDSLRHLLLCYNLDNEYVHAENWVQIPGFALERLDH
jgi:hypothetical protein